MILVCFAVAQEAAPFLEVAPPRARVLVTGMGRIAARHAVEKALAKERPEFLLTSGFAGGLNPALETGAVLHAAAGLPVIQGALQDAGARAGQFYGTDRVVCSRAEKARLWTGTGADAVEMESAHIEEVCRRSGIGCATIRVILDPAGEDLPLDFNRVMGPDQRMAPLKLAQALARKPSLLPRLLRLGRQSRVAAQILARVLARVTSSP